MNIRRIIREVLSEEFEEDLNSDNVIEEGVKEWIVAGSLALASMAPNSLMAQEYDNGNEITKEKIINKIKVAKENGNEKASKLFNNFTEKLNSLKNNDTKEFSTEKDGVTTITQSYTLIDDPSNPGKKVKGTLEQAKDYYNWYIKTDHLNPPTFEKFQVVWNKSKGRNGNND